MSITEIPNNEQLAQPIVPDVFLCRDEALRHDPEVLFDEVIQQLGGFSMKLASTETIDPEIGDPLIDVMNHLGERIMDVTISVVADNNTPGTLIAHIHPRRDK